MALFRYRVAPFSFFGGHSNIFPLFLLASLIAIPKYVKEKKKETFFDLDIYKWPIDL